MREGTRARAEADLPLVVTSLMRGPVYRSQHERVWRHLVPLEPQVNDFVGVLGLTAVIDDVEGFAYLRSRPEDPDEDDPPPRLVARRELSFRQSLLLALLRKRLAEFDAHSSDTLLVLSRDDIVAMIRTFLPDGSNEARMVDTIEQITGKVAELGFLRRLPGDEALWEVRPILKAFVDGQWLTEFDRRLAEYAAAAGAGSLGGEAP